MPELQPILLVEDSEADVWLVQKALEYAHIPNPLQIVRNGEQAIAYLSGRGEYSDRTKFPMPAVVLLDLFMPGIGGFEVLAWIRRQPALQELPVLVLTASLRTADINHAYALGANSFLTKPFDFENVMQLSRNLQAHWCLPQSGAPEQGGAAGAAL